MSYEDDIGKVNPFNQEIDPDSLEGHTLGGLDEVEFSSAESATGLPPTPNDSGLVGNNLPSWAQPTKPAKLAKLRKNRPDRDTTRRADHDKAVREAKAAHPFSSLGTLSKKPTHMVELQKREQDSYEAQLALSGSSPAIPYNRMSAFERLSYESWWAGQLTPSASSPAPSTNKTPDSIRSAALDVTQTDISGLMTDTKKELLDVRDSILKTQQKIISANEHGSEDALSRVARSLDRVDGLLGAEDAYIKAQVRSGAKIGKAPETPQSIEQALKEGLESHLSGSTNMDRYTSDLERDTVYDLLVSGATTSPQADSLGTGGMSEGAKQVSRYRHYSYVDMNTVYDMATMSPSKFLSVYGDASGLEESSIQKQKMHFQLTTGLTLESFAKQIKRNEGEPTTDAKSIRTAYNFFKNSSTYGEQGASIEPLRTGPTEPVREESKDGLVTHKSDAFGEAAKPIDGTGEIDFAMGTLRSVAPRYVMAGIREAANMSITGEPIHAGAHVSASQQKAYDDAVDRATKKLGDWFASGKHKTRVGNFGLDGQLEEGQYRHPGAVGIKADKTLWNSHSLGWPTPSEIPFQGMTHNESVSGNKGSPFTNKEWTDFIQSPEAASMSEEERLTYKPSVRNSIMPAPKVGKKPRASEGLAALAAWEKRRDFIASGKSSRKEEWNEFQALAFRIGGIFEELLNVEDQGYQFTDEDGNTRGDITGRKGLQSSYAAEAANLANELALAGGIDSSMDQQQYAGDYDSQVAAQMAMNASKARQLEDSISDPNAVLDLGAPMDVNKYKQVLKGDELAASLQSIEDAPRVSISGGAGGAGVRSGMYERSESQDSQIRQLVNEGVDVDAAIREVTGRDERTDKGRTALEDVTGLDMYRGYVEWGLRTGEIFEDRSAGWHNQRRGMVTASIAGDLIAKKGGKSQQQRTMEAALTIAERAAGIKSGFVGNKWTLMGVHGEEYARKHFGKASGKTLEPAYFGTIEGHDRIGASPDNLVFDEDGELEAVLELKYLASNDTLSKSFEKYQDQLQLQMLKEKVNKAFFYREGSGGQDPILDVVAADPARQKLLVDTAEEALSLADLYKGKKGVRALQEKHKMMYNIQNTEEAAAKLAKEKKAKQGASIYIPKKEEVYTGGSPFNPKPNVSEHDKAINFLSSHMDKAKPVFRPADASNIDFEGLPSIVKAIEKVAAQTKHKPATTAAESEASFVAAIEAKANSLAADDKAVASEDAARRRMNSAHQQALDMEAKKSTESMKKFTSAVQKSTMALKKLGGAVIGGAESQESDRKLAEIIGMGEQDTRNLRQGLEEKGGLSAEEATQSMLAVGAITTEAQDESTVETSYLAYLRRMAASPTTRDMPVLSADRFMRMGTQERYKNYMDQIRSGKNADAQRQIASALGVPKMAGIRDDLSGDAAINFEGTKVESEESRGVRDTVKGAVNKIQDISEGVTNILGKVMSSFGVGPEAAGDVAGTAVVAGSVASTVGAAKLLSTAAAVGPKAAAIQSLATAGAVAQAGLTAAPFAIPAAGAALGPVMLDKIDDEVESVRADKPAGYNPFSVAPPTDAEIKANNLLYKGSDFKFEKYVPKSDMGRIPAPSQDDASATNINNETNVTVQIASDLNVSTTVENNGDVYIDQYNAGIA